MKFEVRVAVMTVIEWSDSDTRPISTIRRMVGDEAYEAVRNVLPDGFCPKIEYALDVKPIPDAKSHSLMSGECHCMACVTRHRSPGMDRSFLNQRRLDTGGNQAMRTLTLWTVQEPRYTLDGTMNFPMQFRSIEAFVTGMFGNLGAILPNGYIMTLSEHANTQNRYGTQFTVYLCRSMTDEPRRPEVFYCKTKREALIEYEARLIDRIADEAREREKLGHLTSYLETLREAFEDEDRLERDCRIDAMHRSMNHDD